MTEIKSNEREFMSQVVSWLNEILLKGLYPFEIATSETSIKSDKTTRFPDISIWINRQAQIGFCGWELKTPSTLADDAELLKNAADKARAMSANYFITWNMKETIIWRTPQPTEKVSSVYRLKTYQPIHQISTPDDLWINFKQELLKARIREILNDLSTLYKDGHLHLVETDTCYFVHRLSEAVKNFAPFIRASLINEISKNLDFRTGLSIWAIKQGIARYDEGQTFFEIVSRQIIYRLLGKILFYLTLSRFNNNLPKLDLKYIHHKDINRELKRYFESARQIDYQAVFEEDFTDKVPLPLEMQEHFINFVEDLNRYNFSQMPQDVIGNVFEKLIPAEERHSLGQYYTNEDLVDLILGLCIKSSRDNVLDPTCGTGTFLIRAYDRLKALGEVTHSKLIHQIWGVDISHFPAELAAINIYRQKIEDYANFPRVVSKDFFDIKIGDIFKFPTPRPTFEKDQMIDEQIPLFDAIVGNFPYIRQELIEKQIKGYKDKIVKVIAQDWRQEYPELFNNGDINISGQADIYAYLFFHASSFLKEGGRMGIVTSNSWLDVVFGYELQRFFLKNFKIIAIIESRCEPWFEDAAINTIITILERCKDKARRDDNNVKFVKIKKTLEELISLDKRFSFERWKGIYNLISIIESADKEDIRREFLNLQRENSDDFEDANFRIRLVKQGELLEEIKNTNKTVKWGKYLRAPQIYFNILKDYKDKLIPLKDIADIKYGIKTGINEFFYLTDDKIKHWGIEEEFLVPLIKSTKDIETLRVNINNLYIKVFKCSKGKSTLLREGKKGALNYIKWGERQITKERGGYKKGGIFFPEVSSVQGRKYWYDIGDKKPTHFLIHQFVNARLFFPINKKYLADHTVFEGQLKSTKDKSLYLALLNSVITFLGIESSGRLNLGEGLLTFYGPDIEELLIPLAKDITEKHKGKILKAFDKLLDRPIKPIFEEVQMKDRQAFDSAVLEAIGLDPKKYLNLIYNGLTDMVRERLDLAKLRKKRKTLSIQKSAEDLKEQVIEEIIPNGIKKFPEDFVDSKYLRYEQINEISISNKPMKLGSHFMGFQKVIIDEKQNWEYDAPTIDTAKFAIYSQRENSYIIKIPKDNLVIVNAVRDYERYLKNLKDKFFELIMKRTFDQRQSDILTNQIFEEFGLQVL